MTETTIWDIEEHRKEPPGIRNLDFRESFDHLADYLAGYNIREPRTFDPENGGNPLMVRFSGGFYVGGSLNMLRDDPDSPLFGCEIQNIRDEDGHLFITGNRDGGTVGVEVRQLTKAGEPRLDDLTEATYRPPYWVDPVNQAFTPGNTMYDGVLAMWDDPTMAVTPEYAAHSTYLPKARASIERRMTERPDRTFPTVTRPSSPISTLTVHDTKDYEKDLGDTWQRVVEYTRPVSTSYGEVTVQLRLSSFRLSDEEPERAFFPVDTRAMDELAQAAAETAVNRIPENLRPYAAPVRQVNAYLDPTTESHAAVTDIRCGERPERPHLTDLKDRIAWEQARRLQSHPLERIEVPVDWNTLMERYTSQPSKPEDKGRDSNLSGEARSMRDSSAALASIHGTETPAHETTR